MSRDLAFTFKAMRRDGVLEMGMIEAPTRDAAAALIASRGAYALELTASFEGGALRRIGAEDLALGLRALGTLLASGIPVTRALALLVDLAPRSWESALPEIRRRVEQGERLGNALEGSSLPVPSFVLGIVSAGEAGAGLPLALQRAGQLLEMRAAAQAELRRALAYPTVLAVAGSASVALLVGVVLPRFAALLADSGQVLPLSTRLVLLLGAVAKASILPGLITLATAVALWQKWIATPSGLEAWHRRLLSLPGIGTVRRSLATSKACATLSALLDAGVPLLNALPHAARAAGDRAVETELLSARRRIAQGASMSASIEMEGALTPTVTRLARLGEQTGKLSEMLAHGATLEGAAAQRRIQRTIQIVEPALILFFGGIVMMVAGALLQSMYGLRAG